MNSADAARKGRMRAPRGEDHPNAKLTTADVAAIRARLSDGESQRSIGRAFGVGHQYVGDIGAGRFWAHTKGSDYESIERRT